MSLNESQRSFDPESPGPPGAQMSPQAAEALGLLVYLSELIRDGSLHATPWTKEHSQVLGRYHLTALLGTGSYGAVFRAEDTQHNNRSAALKIAWPGVLMDPDSCRRFVEEPAVVSQLRHPGIVHVYEWGRIEMVRYIAYELIEGPSLSQWHASNQGAPARTTVEIIRAVAQAVQFAHQHGVVHRDLKPSNVLLRPDPQSNSGGWQPVVTDFGLARRVRFDAASDQTATGAFLGTDRYMSPEQAAGQAKDSGPPSDIFSLGVILYELVAGARPFDGENPDQIRLRIQHDDPPSIRSRRRDVPRDLETIILKCLEKSPQRRYSSAAALADDLDRFLSHRPITARRNPAWNRAWKFARRNPSAVTTSFLAVVGTLIVAALLGAMVVQQRAAREQVAASAAAAEAAQAAESEAVEFARRHEYATAIQYAARSFQNGNRNDSLEHLRRAQELATPQTPVGIEWHLLGAMNSEVSKIIPAHAHAVLAIDFSPDGRTMYTGGDDGQIFAWDTANWTKAKPIINRGGGVMCMQLSPDGALLATGSFNGRLCVYRVADWKVLYLEKVCKGRLYALTWLGDSSRLAAGGEDAVLSVVDVRTGEVKQTDPLSPSRWALEQISAEVANEISLLTYLKELDLLAVVKSPPETVFIDPSSLEQKEETWQEDVPHTGIVCHLPIDSGWLAIAQADGITLCSLMNRGVVHSISKFMNIEQLHFNSQTGLLAACCRDGSVHVWDAIRFLQTGELDSQSFPGHTGRARSVSMSPDGKYLVSGGEDKNIHVWSNPVFGSSEESTIPNQPHWIEFSPCGRWLMLLEGHAAGTGILRLIEVATGYELWKLVMRRTMTPEGCPVAFDGSGDYITFRRLDESLCEHDSRTGQILTVLKPDGGSLCRCWETDGTLIYTDINSAIFTFDRRAAKASLASGELELIGSYATSRGTLWLETNSAHTLRLTNMPLGRAIRSFEAISDRVKIATMSSDGKFLATVAQSPVIHLWNLHDSKPANRLISHNGNVNNVRFSGDGLTLLSRGFDGTLRLWDLRTNTEYLSIGNESDHVESFALHPKGELLVLGVKAQDRYVLRNYRLKSRGESLLPKITLLSEGAPH
jgi:WD40 repeat protein